MKVKNHKVLKILKPIAHARGYQLPVSLRTNIGEFVYLHSKKQGLLKPLKDEPHLRSWEHWAIIDNAFPYNVAFKEHHLLIPKREVPKSDLSEEECTELEKILDEVSTDYDCHMTNFSKKQSIKNHFHIHLLTYKDSRLELST